MRIIWTNIREKYICLCCLYLVKATRLECVQNVLNINLRSSILIKNSIKDILNYGLSSILPCSETPLSTKLILAWLQSNYKKSKRKIDSEKKQSILNSLFISVQIANTSRIILAFSIYKAHKKLSSMLLSQLTNNLLNLSLSRFNWTFHTLADQKLAKWGKKSMETTSLLHT